MSLLLWTWLRHTHWLSNAESTRTLVDGRTDPQGPHRVLEDPEGISVNQIPLTSSTWTTGVVGDNALKGVRR